MNHRAPSDFLNRSTQRYCSLQDNVSRADVASMSYLESHNMRRPIIIGLSRKGSTKPQNQKARSSIKGVISIYVQALTGSELYIFQRAHNDLTDSARLFGVFVAFQSYLINHGNN